MKYINSGLYYCFLAAMIGLPMGANADVARWNSSRSYSNAYKQVNAQRQGTQQELDNGAGTTAATAAAELPIHVADENLANKIVAGDTNIGINNDTLQQCALIYPDAKFEWAKPTLGTNIGHQDTCTTVVELYAFGAGQNGENVVVARGNLAAGDAFKCNISEFPAENWLPVAGTVVFPNDREPTQEDVEKIMNQEQKQGAGLKIIAGTVLAGLAGNVVGKNEPGSDRMLGGGKSKIISTVAAAAGGGALMAASSYSGKVAGDMIASAGINAALGSVAGNIAGSDKEVLRVEKCDLEGKSVDCLYGHLVTSEGMKQDEVVFIKKTNKNAFMVCKKLPADKYCEVNGNRYTDCFDDCTTQLLRVGSDFSVGEGTEYNSVIDVSAKNPVNKVTVDDMVRDGFSKINSKFKYLLSDGRMISETEVGDALGGEAQEYILVKNGVSKISDRQPAVIAPFKHEKMFGIKPENWTTDNLGDAEVYLRTPLGKLQQCTDFSKCVISNFDPETISASDGNVIDFNNKARLGTTLTGAGAGAGIGAFSAYQGAQTEIQERWTAAVREYKDSLQKFYCWSGNRFLAFYNDAVVIPAMVTDTETTNQ